MPSVTFLSRNLGSYRSIESQGSHALGTIIKPVNENQEYDADRLVYVRYGRDKEPKDYIRGTVPMPANARRILGKSAFGKRDACPWITRGTSTWT